MKLIKRYNCLFQKIAIKNKKVNKLTTISKTRVYSINKKFIIINKYSLFN